jgi:hypothetical protein
VADDLGDVIQEAASEPEEATVDGVHVKQRSLSEVIEADKYSCAKRAMRQKNFGLTRVKIIPPGTV